MYFNRKSLIGLLFTLMLLFDSCISFWDDADVHEGVNIVLSDHSDTTIDEIFIIRNGRFVNKYYKYYSNGMIYEIKDIPHQRSILFNDQGQKICYNEFHRDSSFIHHYYSLDSSCVLKANAGQLKFQYLGKEKFKDELEKIRFRTNIHPGFLLIERRNDTLYLYGRDYDSEMVFIDKFNLKNND